MLSIAILLRLLFRKRLRSFLSVPPSYKKRGEVFFKVINMISVVFHKTKMNYNNRCYDRDAYNDCFRTSTSQLVDLQYPVIPDNPFNLPIASAFSPEEYNYITYVYDGLFYGAFIDKIEHLAVGFPKPTVRVHHTTDSWYFALFNSKTPLHMHGRCERAHVNDWEEAGEGSTSFYPTLKNTSLSPEECFSESSLKMYDIANPCSNNKIPDNVKWLYIYFANPSKVVNFTTDTPGLGQGYFIDGERRFETNGLTVSYPLVFGVGGWNLCFAYKELTSTSLYDGKIGSKTKYYFRPVRDNEGKEGILSNITNQNITAMTISSIPPNDTIKMKRVNYGPNVLYEFESDSVGWQLDYNITGGLPAKCLYFGVFSPVSYDPMNTQQNGKDNFPDLGDFKTFDESIQNDYYAYVDEWIYKGRSSVYNPVFVGDSFLDSSQLIDFSGIQIGVSFDLSSFIIRKKQLNLSGDKQLSIVQNDRVFAPDTVLDYWTRLNALQTGLNTAGSLVNSVKQGISSVSRVKKDPIGAITGVVGTTISAISAKNSFEFAEYQYKTGETTADRSVGFYAGLKEKPLVKIVKNGARDIYGEKLHRYGYNTFLELDVIYKNHRRQSFNYFKTVDCEISGFPRNITDDIENMFNSGVHLWTRGLGNFAQSNYQMNILGR